MTDFMDTAWTKRDGKLIPPKGIVASRWHIDDVKAVIKGSEHEDKPIPSDEKLLEYLKDVVGNEYWVGEMNQALADQLDDLFEEEN